MKKKLLVTLADGNYIEQAKQLFSSVYWNAGWQGDYMLLAYGISQGDLAWFKEKGILVRECEPILKESETCIGHAPLTTLSKFYLFTPEFKKWGNIIFLDGDIIVRRSLDNLARTEGFGAVRILNIFRTNLKGQFQDRDKNNRHLFEQLESRYDLKRPAFNSGVMAFNSDIISDRDFSELKEILSRFQDIINISEETVLNIFFYEKWRELSQVYNVCPSYEIFFSGSRPDALKGTVLHTYSNFPGGKPWNPRSPLYVEWKSNLARAETIDLARVDPPEKKLTGTQEQEYDFYLKNLHRRNLYKFYRFKIPFDFRHNKYRRAAGTFLRNHYPRIYEFQSKLRHGR